MNQLEFKKKKRRLNKKYKKPDDLCRALVRGRGYCQAAGLDDVNCGGMLQWCHIEGRSNKRLRWELYNALCMCAGHHRYYTSRPYLWSIFIREHFPENHDLIQTYINEKWDRDIDAVIERLKKEKENTTNVIDML